MGRIGVFEFIIIAFIGFMFWGNRLPEVAKNAALAVREFKKVMESGGDDPKNQPNSTEQKTLLTTTTRRKRAKKTKNRK